MTKALQSVLVFLVAVSALRADEWTLNGRVVDEAGQPVANATVSNFWSANGTGKHPDGRKLDLSKAEDVRVLWSHVGKMEPRGGVTTTERDGSFTLMISDRYHAVMAMDETRKRGGLAVIPKGKEGLPVDVRIAPLVRVRGKFDGPQSGTQPCWTHVYVMRPEDVTRPLDVFRLAQCGSFESNFEIALPPGKYVLDAYGESTTEDKIDLAVEPNPEIEVTGKSVELDLGTLHLKTKPLSFREKQLERAKADGSWGDYTRHYGQRPPPWHVTDARPLKKDVQLADFHGKWVLVDFWGFSCPTCLGKDLPRLTKFYEAHAADRDRFEIIAFCIDCEVETRSLADVDRNLERIVKHVWGGKPLPFPLLLDPTFTTMQRYGFRGYGTILLFDPHGNLVEGDDITLAERLRGN